MTTTLQAPKIRKLADSNRVEFGPLAFYHPLIADGDTPVRTGIQTSLFPDPLEARRRRLVEVTDSIRERLGEGALVRASLLRRGDDEGDSDKASTLPAVD